MRIVGLVGWSGSGKTTLIERLIPCLMARGMSVSTLKHAHHGFQMDQPGKDSWRHRAAGAREVMVASGDGYALLGGAWEGTEALIGRMAPVDMLLIEGFRAHPYPKVAVHRAALGKTPVWEEVEGVVAVAADGPVACGMTVLDLNAPQAVAAWLVDGLPITAGVTT